MEEQQKVQASEDTILDAVAQASLAMAVHLPRMVGSTVVAAEVRSPMPLWPAVWADRWAHITVLAALVVADVVETTAVAAAVDTAAADRAPAMDTAAAVVVLSAAGWNPSWRVESMPTMGPSSSLSMNEHIHHNQSPEVNAYNSTVPSAK